ncbi:MAG: hypothetical protein K9N55_11485 [Phycisphaerae bacterium]|nr:hypothetical protein [Phycisphaerae bacterium]
MNKKRTQNLNQDGQFKDPCPCKLARKRLLGPLTAAREHAGWLPSWTGIALESPWIQRHISACPRCQRRFAGLGRVFLGLNLMKSQAHSLDLLKQANTSAVNVLKHQLRDSNQANWLKKAVPTASISDRVYSASHGLYQTAACIAILILSKMSVFSSVEHMQKQGQTTVRHFYDHQLGTDLSKDLFSD